MLPSKTLTVYKASAGSGKTFRLAVEYIKLLIENPRAYEGILAVTFTNKATEEMKMRILSQIYGIWKGLPDSDSYLNEVTSGLGISRETASQRAGEALRMLLHNYHYFRVQTIDTFFQSVLRNLAKELQLNAGLRVGLNNKQVVEQAVDELIDTLSTDREMMHIVLEYMHDNMAENKAWNIIGQLKRFGTTIFTELYKQNRGRMDAAFGNPDFFEQYKKKMRVIISTIADKYKAIGRQALKSIEEKGLQVDDFCYKTMGPISYFLKLSNGIIKDDLILTTRVVDAMSDAEKWTSKSSKKRDNIITVAKEVLIPLIEQTESTRTTDSIKYNTALATLKHINDVRLLRKIEDTAHSLNNAAQRFMLSDTQSLLHEMIDDSDVSFIFEKIGARLEHVMIDEFQDTSTIQWANFKPLLYECMSHGFTNLIVGDVKQSIYRFRNGDWRLLNNIHQEFDSSLLEFPPIRTNRRSDRNVINFNNAFFKIVAAIEADEIREYSEKQATNIERAYADVEQDIPKEREETGLVHIEMLPHDMLDEMEERTLQCVTDLVEMGIKQSDIAILTRNGKEIPLLATYIESKTEGRIRVVSEEAFRLDASAAVRIIVNAMTIMIHPKDQIALASIVTDYFIMVLDDREALIQAFSNGTSLEQLLPKGFVERRDELLTMSLHDMAEEIIRIFSLEGCIKETAYLTKFFDCINDFCDEMAPVIEDFITAWATNIANTTIESAKCNGIRILTIHKSKGLEAPHVIIPYCNWKGNPPRSSLIWVSPKEQPFDELPLVPLDYSNAKTLQGTIYEEEGYEEYIQTVVDNLNLLYVAMTRAKHSLFIIGERNTKTNIRSKVICQAIERLPAEINGQNVYIDGMDSEEEVLTVTYGHLNVTEKKKIKTNNVFTPEIIPYNIKFSSCVCEAKFRQSNDSLRFAQDYVDDTDKQRMIKLGMIMHLLFANIKTMDDIEPALQRMEFDGVLYDDDLTQKGLLDALREKFKDKQICDWFSDRWNVYNECSIISPDGKTHRPDRVITNGKETIVIDFKFGRQSAQHKQQVKEYMQLLEKMGMKNISGFLWYVTLSEIEKV